MGDPITVAIVASVITAVVSAVVSYYLVSKYSPETEKQELNVTTVEEGSPVPIVYGKVRIPGNLVYYGNVEYTSPDEGGGKGGGCGGGGKSGGGGGSGFYYRIDAAIVFCCGRADFIQAYFDEKKPKVSGNNYELTNDGYISDFDWNNGEGSVSLATFGVTYGNTMPGVAWARLNNYRLGESRASIHKIEAVVQKVLPTTINHANMDSGSNPAAVIYDLLTDNFYGLGVLPDRINMTKFNEAADYWYSKNYGINYVFRQKGKFSGFMDKIMSWTPCSFYMDAEGKYSIQVFDPDQTSVASLNETHFVEFSLQRPTYQETINEIRAKWINPADEYKETMNSIRNSANARMQEQVITRSVDLSAFTNSTAVSVRMWEMIKAASYPTLRFEFTLTLLNSDKIYPGCCVTISHDDYGMSNVKCRILEVSTAKVNEDKLSYTAEQMVEAIVDASFEDFVPPSPAWEDPEVEPDDVPYARIFELPWTVELQTQTFALLAQRAGQEEGAAVYTSLTGTDYINRCTLRTWSYYGTLAEEYPANTFTIDDDVGFLITPYSDTELIQSISRTNLFYLTHVIIIGNEVMKVQIATPEGETDYRITGVIRGMYNTPIETHPIGSPVWVFFPIMIDTDSNLLVDSVASAFYTKFVTFAAGWNMAIDEATAWLSDTPAQKYRIVESVNMLEAVRDVSNNITVTWFPTSKQNSGAGDIGEANITDNWPFNFDGVFEYQIGSADIEVLTTCQNVDVHVGQVDIRVRQCVDGVYSDWVTVTVGADVGTYYNEIGSAPYA